MLRESIITFLAILLCGIGWTWLVHTQAYRLGFRHGRKIEAMEQRHARERADEEQSNVS